MDDALNERTLTVEMVKSVVLCDNSTSPELEGLKRDARTKKRRIRNAATSRREYVVGKYLQAREDYERAVADAQTTSWKRFCSAQDGESMWDGIYRVIKEIGKNREDVLLKTDSGQVLGPDESATRNFGDLPGVDPPFTGAEIRNALKAFHPQKALDIDEFTSDICQAAIFWDLRLFLAMANKCLELRYFHRAWKVAAIKVIPKPGKEDYGRPKSYCPIGLLSVLGKTVERMLVGRLQWHLMPKLQVTQYGFTPQRETEDALYNLMTHIYKELNLKKIILMVSLDIESAFDNAWWPALETQLRAQNCPVNLHGMVRGYLRDREVVVRYVGGECRKRTSKGCIQGSIAGPTFWNLILDFLLRELGELGVYVQAFADDVVLMFSGTSVLSIEKKANRALTRVHCWRVRNKLRFAPTKTNSMMLTKKLKYDYPVVHMNGEQISSV
ncbi:Retrovirus-related Pol polyprotein from type-1 retrotransposable element R1 [Eumeta japonica]|uniref:Retrovirus-related Pol polyprotein from type-1 retrotransposable element R1 n=1 Tax=Eumeta variegata TaxID=151549 RepID=A0A4C2A6Q1_EUMVA|nr:Retrovirus-related Pol polyprotein from type-1 retrotransposable element R1 [Eumeta japonica]